jgi:integrase/recombinase XerC
VRGLVYASESHLADCRFRHLSTKTLTLYQEYEQSFIKWCAHSGLPLTLPTLNASNAKAFAEYIRTRRGGKRDGEWAARAAVSTLKIWSRYLVDEDILEADYLSRLRLPKATKIARQAYEAWEIQALRGAMADGPTSVRDLAILSLLLDTGMRVSELVGMRMQDLDLQARHVLIHGKGRLERVVPFGNSTSRDGGSTVRRLRAYLAQRWVHPKLLATDRDRVWMSIHGRPLTDVGVRTVFAKAATTAGLTHQEVHATRHTFAVRHLVKNPGDIEGLRYLLGHLSTDMYRVYAGQAGALIAEVAGRESVADAMFAEESPERAISRPRLLPVLSSGVGSPRAGEQRPGPALPVKDRQEPGRLPTRSKAGRRHSQ